MIRFEHVTKEYPNGHVALKQVSFELKEGEMTFLTGHSGAGKSTLLKIIALLEDCSVGKVWLGDHAIANLHRQTKPLLRRRMGVILQSPMLFLEQTAYHNVALPLVIAGAPTKEIPRRVRAALDKVGLLSKENVLCSNLSLGEQQRTNIARAVVNRPTILLADEPTGNLDPALANEIMQLFSEFNRIGTNVLIATHNLSLIDETQHRVLQLQQGRLISGGSR
jgi:cell division transport system ATP-binding protein